MPPNTDVILPGKVPSSVYVYTFIHAGTYRGFTVIHILRRMSTYLSYTYRTSTLTYTKQGDIVIIHKYTVTISYTGACANTYKSRTALRKFRPALYDLCSRVIATLPDSTWKGTHPYTFPLCHLQFLA